MFFSIIQKRLPQTKIHRPRIRFVLYSSILPAAVICIIFYTVSHTPHKDPYERPKMRTLPLQLQRCPLPLFRHYHSCHLDCAIMYEM